MYAVIAYKEALENEILVRIYNDSTEKHFQDLKDAEAYHQYLINKLNSLVDLYIVEDLTPGQIDIDELKRQDALAKLTDEEKQLLGIS